MKLMDLVGPHLVQFSPQLGQEPKAAFYFVQDETGFGDCPSIQDLAKRSHVRVWDRSIIARFHTC
ncbi:hypothetical protein CDN99_20320 [Roseateles aquatilis]|uniref:Uncharacterized protein n=1 Tax=Roseateles aquatilis TaxID=431061 RepID=A0A246J0R1_9BURK|nr:hypothetical protein CDN99_20320 [Roseateles aquatilis]